MSKGYFLLLAVYFLCVEYLLFSFVILESNPLKWTQDARFWFVAIPLMFALFGYLLKEMFRHE